MSIHIQEERKREQQLEKKLTSTNLKVYAPLFTHLCSVIEDTLGFQKAVLYLYDDNIKIFYNLSGFHDTKANSKEEEKTPQGILKIHSKRGFIGKIFSE